MYHSSNEAAFNQTNWGANVESTHTFSKTISAGSFYKLAVTYSTDDIYLINDSSITISGVENAYAYTGSPISPEPVVVCNGRTLTKENYSISYLNIIYPGTATLLITGKGLFHGSVSKDFDIVDPQLVWSAGSTVQLTENRITMNPILVTGTGNVTLGIADGVTLKAERGIIIDAGATLTVEGPGSLMVSNKMGENGTLGGNGYDGGNGSPGSTGIRGSLIVNGGTVDVAGSSGGAGGEGGSNGSYEVHYRCGNAGSGADGGAGIDGSLIVYNGTVTIEGRRYDLTTRNSKEINELRSHTEMVFQQFNLFRQRTALANVMEGLTVVKGMDEKTARETALYHLRKVGMEDRLFHYPKHLSGGQQQRVAIARALAMDPLLLLMDEPTSALDPELVGEVLQTVRSAAQEGNTILLVTHEMPFVRSVAKRVIFLENGKIVADGTAKDIFEHPDNERLRRFLININMLETGEYAT